MQGQNCESIPHKIKNIRVDKKASRTTSEERDTAMVGSLWLVHDPPPLILTALDTPGRLVASRSNRLLSNRMHWYRCCIVKREEQTRRHDGIQLVSCTYLGLVIQLFEIFRKYLERQISVSLRFESEMDGKQSR